MWTMRYETGVAWSDLAWARSDKSACSWFVRVKSEYSGWTDSRVNTPGQLQFQYQCGRFWISSTPRSGEVNEFAKWQR